jgi:iron-sulfur cluster repair protein YtfE (RIC family)
MSTTSLPEALTREHREIDAGIETFVAGLDRGVLDPQPLLGAFDALRRHIYLEEELLFPPIRAAGLMMPLMVMLREHGTLWELMDELTDLVARPGAEGTGSGSADLAGERVLATCRELLTRLDQHNSKEEPIVYPHAETDLTGAAAAELAEFLRTGSTPDGWVCEALA